MSVQVSEHPAAAALLGEARDATCPAGRLRRIVGVLSGQLVTDATRRLALSHHRVRTPIDVADVARLVSAPTFVPVLRAGLWMLPGALNVVEDSPVRAVGMVRDHGGAPECYLNDLPEDFGANPVVVLDPMIATGTTLLALGRLLERRRPGPVSVCGLLAAPIGLERIAETHPDWQLHIIAVDERLDRSGYIVPGLGDAGDRLNG